MMQPLDIQSIMTPSPRFVSADDPLTKVQQEMEERSFRHMPVLIGEQIVGIVSDRDVTLALSLAGADGGEELTAADICTPEPYTVDIRTRLDEVLKYMGETKIGSVIVTSEDKMVGIITTTDVCRACGSFFEEYFQNLS